MDENILLYEVKPGDTLDNIGEKIGMSGDQLKDFHNTHCERMEKLWFNNLVGVKQIIIPKEYKNPEDLRKAKENEMPPSTVTRDFYADSYLAKEDLEIEYQVDINFRSKEESNITEEIAEVRCFGFTKKGQLPDDKMSAVSLACMESIYPIPFIIPCQGKIAGIFEFEKLKQRFEEKRQDLEAFFTGEIYKSYFDKFLESLGNRDYILKQFFSALLYQLLFPKMEWFHMTREWTENFYLIQNSFSLRCSMRAEYEHKGTEIVETLLRGTVQDAYSLQEILRGISFGEAPEELAECDIEIRYITDKKTKRMLEAEATVIFKNEDALYRKQTLKLTQHEKIS
ncbi:hypothetical protein LUD75_01050 [Epilithonimonas sp. JDS]|uniref:hypothetical protein n=1 Tax=Epilithonimonas sp. JDS TaxID=2902797 RepID=UPI001E4E456B|nr:hypothetical protein [Epilithonimonas sp. JDS]MCD9853274.1 hypothetical protein [Epilithonimonas sp. JDS]